MVRAKGPVWHQKQKKRGIIPSGLHGLDKQATWSKSKADGWIYGHGTFCITSHKIPVIGLFQWMPNCANEAKRMEQDIVRYSGIIKQVFMDSKADDQVLYWKLKYESHIQLVTAPRKFAHPSRERKQMFRDMLTPANRKAYKERSTTVEPMQGLMADIFELDRCWMRGDANNRWLFAAMGTAVQIAQLRAFEKNKSTWNVKTDVLGI